MANLAKPEWVGDLCHRRPWITLLIVLAVSLAGIYGIRNIQADENLGATFQSERPIFKTFQRLRALFPATDRQVYLVASAPDLVSPEKLNALRDLHLDLALLNGVDNVISVFSARHPPDAKGETAPVFPELLPDHAGLKALIAGNRANPLIGTRMLAKDGTATVIIVLLDETITDRRKFEPVLSEINQLVAEKADPAGIRVEATGYRVFVTELAENMSRDRRLLNLSGLAITIVICILFLGGIRLAILTSLPAIIALIWSMGSFGLLGQKITPLTNILPPLVLVIAFSTALHLVYRFRTKYAEGYNVSEAMHIAVHEIGPACALTCLTTASAMGLLCVSSSPVIRQVGLFGSAAVLVTYIITITVVPATAALLFAGNAGKAQVARETGFLRLTRRLSEFFAHLAMRHSAAVVITAVVLLAVTATAYMSLNPYYFYRHQLPVNSTSHSAAVTVDEKLGGLDTVRILIERKDTSQATASDADIAIIRRAHEMLEGRPAVSLVWSPETMSRWLASGTPKARPATVDERELGNYQRDYVDRLTSKQAPAWLVTGYLADTSPKAVLPLLRGLERDVAAFDAANPAYRVSLTGLFTVSNLESRRMIKVLQNGLLVAICLAFVAISVWFRSIRIAAISMLPNLLPITAAAAFIYLARPGLQMSHVVALIVAFGIAVDDTVQFLRRFTLERMSMRVADAVAWTATHVGPVLIATSVILALGFGVTLASNLPSIQMFGVLCFVVFVVALLGDILVLPAAILLARRALSRDRAATRTSEKDGS